MSTSQVVGSRDKYFGQWTTGMHNLHYVTVPPGWQKIGKCSRLNQFEVTKLEAPQL